MYLIFFIYFNIHCFHFLTSTDTFSKKKKKSTDKAGVQVATINGYVLILSN